MPVVDRYGLVLSTPSEMAAERYQVGIDLMLSGWTGAADALDEAIVADPSFAMAYAARARLHAMRAETDQARACIAQAATWARRNGTEREQRHIDVLSLAVHGQSAKALAGALDHLERWPRDVIIFSLPMGAFGLFAFSGMADHDQARVALCERHARHFPQNDWWFLGSRGWAHGEQGNLILGRELTHRSLELRRNNANALHAHIHVLHEEGAHVELAQIIDDWLPGYCRTGILHGHIAWHAALAALERDDLQRALGVYTSQVAPAVSAGMPINVISDSASFLWRLLLDGIELSPSLWRKASDYASGFFQEGGFPFADLHMAILAAATGNRHALEQRLKALDDLVSRGQLGAGRVAPALCRAVQAFAEGRYEACARLLEPIAHEIVRIGGSGAQREVAEDTLLVAFIRSGQASKARELLQERLHRRPSRRDSRWLAGLSGS